MHFGLFGEFQGCFKSTDYTDYTDSDNNPPFDFTHGKQSVRRLLDFQSAFRRMHIASSIKG